MSATQEQSKPMCPKTLLKKIEQASKKTPRFLFAFGVMNDTNRSAIVNTSSITPQYFLRAAIPTKFYHMPPATLCDLNEALSQSAPHRLPRAIWSAWGTSVHYSVECAVELCAENGRPMSDLRRERAASCFGVIPQCAFAVVPLSTLHEQIPFEELLGLDTIHPSGITLALTDVFADASDWSDVRQRRMGYRWPGELGVHEEITIAKEFGKAFGKHLALPVACMAIATLGRHPQHQIDWLHEQSAFKSLVVEGFKDMEVVRQSFKGQSIMRENKRLLADPDARRGMSLFRAIIQSRQSKYKKHAGSAVQNLIDDFSRFRLGMQLGLLEPDYGTESVFSTPFPSPDGSGASDEDEDEEEPPLPSGRMDDATKRQLLLAQKRTPRYLFRAWNNTDHLSGGFKGLNSITAITPRAYLHNKSKAAASIYDLRAGELCDMCQTHLRTSKHSSFYSQLSSWAASLPVAFHFAKGNAKNCYISSIDTQELADSNTIVHVPSLDFLLGYGHGYHHEYLAHGVITGSSLRAIPFKAFQDAGVSTSGSWMTQMHLGAKHMVTKITQAEIGAARTVAQSYGGKFSAAVFVAILALKQRSPDFWRSEKELEKALPLFVEATKTYWTPSALCGDASILTDIVYTTGYENVEQMIKMLRALVNWRHGEGARVRWKHEGESWLASAGGRIQDGLR